MGVHVFVLVGVYVLVGVFVLVGVGGWLACVDACGRPLELSVHPLLRKQLLS